MSATNFKKMSAQCKHPKEKVVLVHGPAFFFVSTILLPKSLDVDNIPNYCITGNSYFTVSPAINHPSKNNSIITIIFSMFDKISLYKMIINFMEDNFEFF